jgi:hypothetical protein
MGGTKLCTLYPDAAKDCDPVLYRDLEDRTFFLTDSSPEIHFKIGDDWCLNMNTGYLGVVGVNGVDQPNRIYTDTKTYPFDAGSLEFYA